MFLEGPLAAALGDHRLGPEATAAGLVSFQA
jgi:hypothetical protein